MTPIDLTNVLKDAAIGEWLALSFARDRIVAHSIHLSEAMDAALELGEKQPIMMKLPPPHALILSLRSACKSPSRFSQPAPNRPSLTVQNESVQ